MKQSSRRPIKIPTVERLKNIALYYLSRYAASEASLRRVLHTRMRRAHMAYPDFAADHKLQADLCAAIEQIIASHKKTGAVNDAFIADMKVASLRRSGRSEKFIRQKLTGRGIEKTLISRALENHDGEENGQAAEAKAALAYAKRRRLGSFRDKTKDVPRQKELAMKDFAALARAGFSTSIIRKILHTSPDDEPESFDD